MSRLLTLNPDTKRVTIASPETRRIKLFQLILLSVVIVVVVGGIQIWMGSFNTSGQKVLACVVDANLWRHPATLLRLVMGDSFANSMGAPPAVPLATETLIVWNVRIPRVIVGVLIGMNLAIAGAIFQVITRNELASPYILGVSSGSGLAIMIVMVLYPHLGVHLPLIASLGGAGAFLLVYAIAWNHGTSSTRLVLAGVIVGAIAGSIQHGLFLVIRDLARMQDAVSWLAGSLTGVGWAQVRYAAPWTVIVVVLALCSCRYLDVLALGDAAAQSLGMHVERVRFFLAAIAIVAAATTVSVAGLVGFVGLIVPHIIRATVGSSSRLVLVGCLAVGPALMVSADAVARLAFRPVQLPVGIVTGVLGGVWFLYLMRRNRRVVRP